MKSKNQLFKKGRSLVKAGLIIGLSWLSLSGLHAQSLYVLKTSNLQSTYNVKDLQCLSFKDGLCLINDYNGSNNSIAIDQIRLLSFTNYQSTIPLKEFKEDMASFSFYPNPTTEVLNVKMNTQNDMAALEIFSTSGQLILEKNFSSEELHINVSALKSGIYLCKVRTKNAFEVKPFIKK